MTTTTAFVEILSELIKEPRAYSGRGMFGKQCIAVSNISKWDLAIKLGELGVTDIEAPYEDNLGFTNVLYWPSMEWTKELEGDDA